METFQRNLQLNRLKRAVEWLLAPSKLSSSAENQRLFWALLFGFTIAIFRWSFSDAMVKLSSPTMEHLCWPHYPDCTELAILQKRPEGYTQYLLYAVLLSSLAMSAWLGIRRRWTLAVTCLFFIVVAAGVIEFFVTSSLTANYYYWLFPISFGFLFSKDKAFVCQRVLVAQYLAAATLKLNDGWLLGTYFTSLDTGLPLIPGKAIPLATLSVIAMETAGAVSLLSSRRPVWQSSLFLLVAFHLYSTLFVGLTYPIVCLSVLLATFAFGPVQATLKKFPPILAFLAIALTLSTVMPFFQAGDRRMTLENNKYRFYMFEANHQCRSQITVYSHTGQPTVRRDYRTDSARRRCAPWAYLQNIQRTYCHDAQTVVWKLDHSINGGPFFRIVDVDDACITEYKFIGDNPWIRNENDAEQVGWPLQNNYY